MHTSTLKLISDLVDTALDNSKTMGERQIAFAGAYTSVSVLSVEIQDPAQNALAVLLSSAWKDMNENMETYRSDATYLLSQIKVFGK